MILYVSIYLLLSLVAFAVCIMVFRPKKYHYMIWLMFITMALGRVLIINHPEWLMNDECNFLVLAVLAVHLVGSCYTITRSVKQKYNKTIKA